MSATKLNAKQREFAKQWLIDFNGTQAAIRAGYAKNSANVHAARLLAKANIQEYLVVLKAEIAKSHELTLDELITDARFIKNHCKQVEKNNMKNSKDALKAIELLGKLGGLIVDKAELNVTSIKVVREKDDGTIEELETGLDL